MPIIIVAIGCNVLVIAIFQLHGDCIVCPK